MIRVARYGWSSAVWQVGTCHMEQVAGTRHATTVSKENFAYCQVSNTRHIQYVLDASNPSAAFLKVRHATCKGGYGGILCDGCAAQSEHTSAVQSKRRQKTNHCSSSSSCSPEVPQSFPLLHDYTHMCCRVVQRCIWQIVCHPLKSSQQLTAVYFIAV